MLMLRRLIFGREDYLQTFFIEIVADSVAEETTFDFRSKFKV